MDQKETALREVRKLINVLNTWGNVLVPSLNQKKTTAKERLKHFSDYLINDEGMTIEEIDVEVLNLGK